MKHEQQFPDDENGHVLRSIAESGVDLTVERSVEFAHRAPDEAHAHAFASAATKLGFVTEVYEPDVETTIGVADWDVICARTMVPTHAAITEAEMRLASVAEAHGCQADGWGFTED